MKNKTEKSRREIKREQIYTTANYLINELKKEGITIQRYDSKSSNSVYLKLDYGVLNSIRISDHKGKKHLNYKYNLLTICPYPISTNNKTSYGEVIRHYAPLNEKEKMIELILKDRYLKVDSYGESNYRSFMDIKIAENYMKTGFWQQGKIV